MESVRRELGLKRIIKLASNENPLGPSPKALRAMSAVAKKLFLYPDGGSTQPRRAISKKAGVPYPQVIIGEGSDELIELLGKTFLNSSDSIVVSAHAFIRYRMAGELMGAKVLTVPMRNYTHDLVAMGKAIVSTDADGLLDILTPDHDALIVPKANAEALADKIVWAIDHPEVRARLSSHARQTGRQYDIDVFVRKMERLYELLHEVSRATRRRGALRADLSFLTSGTTA